MSDTTLLAIAVLILGIGQLALAIGFLAHERDHR